MRPVTRVLIVDDHPIFRRGISGVINREPDLEVVGEAGDGPQAIAQVAALTPDIVLMDLQLPGMTGCDAIQQIHEQWPKIGIVILTTYSEDEDIFRGIDAGARGYLMKEAPPGEVIQAIREVSHGGSLIEPRIATRILDEFNRLSRESASKHALSARESEVLKLMAEGLTNNEIAAALDVGTSTVKTHVRHVFEKLDVSDRTEAVARAIRNGLLPDK